MSGQRPACPAITHVHRFGSMVMVFDQQGNQMPAYNGPYAQVREAILRDAPASARFYIFNWKPRMVVDLPREEF